MTFETFVAWKKAKLERMQVGACDDDDDDDDDDDNDDDDDYDDDDGVANDNEDTNASSLF